MAIATEEVARAERSGASHATRAVKTRSDTERVGASKTPGLTESPMAKQGQSDGRNECEPNTQRHPNLHWQR